MISAVRFPKSKLSLIHASKILGIRAGLNSHRFTGIWVVVVGDRVFVRPWNNKASGWCRAFEKDSRGAIRVSGREIPIRARKTRGVRLLDAIDFAYGEKYHTPASRKWVRGLVLPRRRQTTVELLPRSSQ